MSCGTAVGTRCRESARRAEPESGALSGQACLRSKYAGLPLQSFIVRAGGARLGRAPLVAIPALRAKPTLRAIPAIPVIPLYQSIPIYTDLYQSIPIYTC